MHAEGPESFLAYGVVVVGKPLHNQIDKSVFSCFCILFGLMAAKKFSVDAVVFYYYSEGIKYRSGHLAVIPLKELFQIANELIQLPRRKVQHDNSQIIRYIF